MQRRLTLYKVWLMLTNNNSLPSLPYSVQLTKLTIKTAPLAFSPHLQQQLLLPKTHIQSRPTTINILYRVLTRYR